VSLLRRAKARDANEAEIVRALRDVGAGVFPLDLPLDLLVAWRGKTMLMEVKLPVGPEGGDSHSRLRPGQQRFIATWPGQVAVVRTPAEALAAIGARIRPEAFRDSAGNASEASQDAPQATIAPQDDSGIGPD